MTVAADTLEAAIKACVGYGLSSQQQVEKISRAGEVFVAEDTA